LADTPAQADLAGPAQRESIRALGEMVLCSGVPTQVLIALLLSRLGLASGRGDSLSLVFVSAVSLLDTVVLVGLMVWFLRPRGPSPRSLWLGSRPLAPEAVAGVVMSPFIFIAVGSMLLAIQRLAPWMHNVGDNPLEAMARRGLIDAAVLGVVAVVAGAVREELQRAFLVDRFERHLGPTWLGVVLLSVAFGLGHSLQGWDAVVVTGVLGAVWAVVYVRRRSIVAALVSHAIFNSLEIVRMLSLQR
jgi:membrane protease YdiL (CAAX protease family)